MTRSQSQMVAMEKRLSAPTLRRTSPAANSIGFVRRFCSERKGNSIASRLSRQGGSAAVTRKSSSWTTVPMAEPTAWPAAPASAAPAPGTRCGDNPPHPPWLSPVFREPPGSGFPAPKPGVSRTGNRNRPLISRTYAALNVKTLSSYEESLWSNGNPSPGGAGDNPGGGRSREAKQRDGSPGNEDNDGSRSRFGLEGSDH